MGHGIHTRLWHTAREYAGHWMIAGIILAATGAAPEHWFSELLHDVDLPTDALHLWHAGIDLRIALIGTGLLMIAGDIAWRRTRPTVGTASSAAVPPPSSEALPLPDRPSIAVLPFANLSGDPEQEYFSDGVADDIITELSRDRALFVIARNSSFTYRGRTIDTKQVGRELGVRYVVDGSVRREAGRVRVTAQLIDSTTGSHVWAERYDRALEHVFAVQDEIAASVASAIRPAVAGAEQQRVMRKPPGSLTAWETYHRGVWHLWNNAPSDYEQARKLFQQAADIDPGFARAFAGLALTYVMDTLVYASRPFAEAGRMAEAAARKAVALDPNDAEAQFALAISFVCFGDSQAALDGAERALALNRSCAAAHELKGGSLIYTGRPKEGRDEALVALRMNPRDATSTRAATIIVASYYLENDYVAAIEAARRCLATNPGDPRPRRYLVAALGQLGRKDEAAAELHAFRAKAPAVFDATVRHRPPYMSPECHEHLVDGVRKAGWEG